MALNEYKCPSCDKRSFSLGIRTVVCPDCKEEMRKVPHIANVYISERDKAEKHSENLRYKEWKNSPEVQEKIMKGELVPEGPNSNALSDDLNSLESSSTSSEGSLNDS